MKAILRESKRHAVLIDLEGEGLAERVLLSHLQDEHVSILCAGKYEEHAPAAGMGLRLFIRNEGEIEITRRVEPGIQRRLKRKTRRRR